MGSRIMHLIIANQIADKIPLIDKYAFIVGGIAPDAVSPKALSHFFEGEVTDFSRSIAYEKFHQKYDSQQAYILGYYIHLIADDLWLKGFYLPWLKNRIENDNNIIERYHNDFRLLNEKLIEHYQITSEIIDGIDSSESIINLEEVSAEDVKAFLPYLKEDMNYKSSDLDIKLDIFTFEQIIGYIETSVEKGCLLLTKNEVNLK